MRRSRHPGAAALFVSHDPLDAWRLADRVAVLEEGRLTQFDVPAESQFCVFEAGRNRAYWRIAGVDGDLCSHEASAPPAAAQLAIAPDHVLVYPGAGEAAI